MARAIRILRSLQAANGDPDLEKDEADNEEEPPIMFETSGLVLDLFDLAHGQLNSVLESPLFLPTFSQ